jgi:hypothetical protein
MSTRHSKWSTSCTKDTHFIVFWLGAQIQHAQIIGQTRTNYSMQTQHIQAIEQMGLDPHMVSRPNGNQPLMLHITCAIIKCARSFTLLLLTQIYMNLHVCSKSFKFIHALTYGLLNLFFGCTKCTCV